MNRNTLVTFNQRLRELRLHRGWSQQALADQLGTTVITVKRWERGIHQPSAYFRLKLDKLFNQEELDQDKDRVNEIREITETISLSSNHTIQELKNDITIQQTNFIPTRSDPNIPLSPKEQHLVGRTELLSSLVEQLCSGANSYAITGLPGVGKTALVTTLAHHPQIRQSFRDGILWVGPGCCPQPIEDMKRWGKLLGMAVTDTDMLTNSDAWARRIHEQIGSRRMLLIIDDVWQLTIATLFKLGGERCAHVITTRLPSLAAAFAPEAVIHLFELKEEDGLRLMQQKAPYLTDKFVPELRDLIRSVGTLPLAITLIGRYINQVAHCNQPHRIWDAVKRLCQDVESRLHLAIPQLPWEGASSWPTRTNLSLYTTIELSDLHLPQAAQKALYTLSAAPSKPHSFSKETAYAVYGIDCDILDLLIDSGLVEQYQTGQYWIHKTITDYAHLKRAESNNTTRIY